MIIIKKFKEFYADQFSMIKANKEKTLSCCSCTKGEIKMKYVVIVSDSNPVDATKYAVCSKLCVTAFVAISLQ